MLPNKEVRTALVLAFAGITDSGVAVKAFDSVATSTTSGLRIVILNQSNRPNTTKGGFGYRHEVNITVVDSTVQATGRERTESIANEVITRLMPPKPGLPILVLPSPWQVWDIQLDSSMSLDVAIESPFLYRQVLTFFIFVDKI